MDNKLITRYVNPPHSKTKFLRINQLKRLACQEHTHRYEQAWTHVLVSFISYKRLIMAKHLMLLIFFHVQMVRHCSKITRTDRQWNKELLAQPLEEESKTKPRHTSYTLYAKYGQYSKLWLRTNFLPTVSEIVGFTSFYHGHNASNRGWGQGNNFLQFLVKQVWTSCRSSRTSLYKGDH